MESQLEQDQSVYEKKMSNLIQWIPNIYRKLQNTKAILQIYVRKQVELGLEGRELGRQVV